MDQNNKEDCVFIKSRTGDKIYFDTEAALAILLEHGVLFANAFDYYRNNVKYGHTITLFVNCNDVFVWGCADSEDVTYEEVESLYKLWYKDHYWGTIKWLCLKRNEKPQRPIVKAMKELCLWDEEMEKLPDNEYDKIAYGEQKSR